MDMKVTPEAAALAQKFPLHVQEEFELRRLWEFARNAIIGYSRLNDVFIRDFYHDKFDQLRPSERAKAFSLLQYAYPEQIERIIKEYRND